VTETMPGVARETIVAETGFKVIFARDCREMAAPTTHELKILREEIDPLGIRRLEFVGAKDRGGLLDEILRRDLEGTAQIIGEV
jgi:glutaconate CoA-transferase subunit A